MASTTEKKSRKSRYSPRMLEVLVDLVIENSQLLEGKFDGSKLTHGKKLEKWESIARDVNAVNTGDVRSYQEIQDKWVRMKSDVKAKSSKIRRLTKQTGGAVGGVPVDIPVLTELEKKILTVIPSEQIESILPDDEGETLLPLPEPQKAVPKVMDMDANEESDIDEALFLEVAESFGEGDRKKVQLGKRKRDVDEKKQNTKIKHYTPDMERAARCKWYESGTDLNLLEIEIKKLELERLKEEREARKLAAATTEEFNQTAIIYSPTTFKAMYDTIRTIHDADAELSKSSHL